MTQNGRETFTWLSGNIVLEGMLQDVRQFCIKEGIDSARIDGMLGKFAPRRRKDSKFYTLVKLVMSTASINNNDNESVSSSSMENDLRDYANRDSVLNEATSNDGTITSLRQYLSVPFSSGLESRSISDVESIAGDVPQPSPSIYVTSPASDDGSGMFTFCDVDMEANDLVMTHHDGSESLDEEGNGTATIPVTSNTTTANNMNGVAFYVGSQISLNFQHSQENLALTAGENSQDDHHHVVCIDSSLREEMDANRNVSVRSFGQYLTVPHCTIAMTSLTNTPSISDDNQNCNNNIELDGSGGGSGGSRSSSGDESTAGHTQPLLPQNSDRYRMQRSASDHEDLSSSLVTNDAPIFQGPLGSPVPIRRKPALNTKRKNYVRSKSESQDKDNEFVGLLKHEKIGRLRRNSGDPHMTMPPRASQQQRARSHSPSPMSLLNVPGIDEVTCSASRSMNDVSTAGNPCANNLGSDGKILRRSCLSLNSEGRKRRAKSPHRVSFKVS